MLTCHPIGSGIGREVALTLASRGARALICADINMRAAQETAHISHSRKAAHVTKFAVSILQVDVRDEKSVQYMFDETNRLFGRIDYFVNTAGVGLDIVMVPYAMAFRQL